MGKKHWLPACSQQGCCPAFCCSHQLLQMRLGGKSFMHMQGWPSVLMLSPPPPPPATILTR
jgi:hypothetical protein